MEERYLDIKGAVQYCGLSERYLFKKRMDKAIKYLKFGKKIMFDIKDLDRFMQENAIEPVDWEEKIKEMLE